MLSYNKDKAFLLNETGGTGSGKLLLFLTGMTNKTLNLAPTRGEFVNAKRRGLRRAAMKTSEEFFTTWPLTSPTIGAQGE